MDPNAYYGMTSSPGSIDPFFAQVPTGPRYQPVFGGSKPVSPFARIDNHPFLHQIPTGLQQQPASPWSNRVSPFSNQVPTNWQQQTTFPWSKRASAQTHATSVTHSNQILGGSQQPRISSPSDTAPPLMKTDKDTIVNWDTSSPQQPVWNRHMTVSPLIKGDETNLSTPTSSHQRVASSPWNQAPSVATSKSALEETWRVLILTCNTAPPSDPTRPRLRVLIPVASPTNPNRPQLPPSALRAQPSRDQSRNVTNESFANCAARASRARVPNPAPSHTNSKVWTNDKTARHERWSAIEKRLQKMEFIEGSNNSGKDNIHRSPFVPKNFEQYLEHCHLYNQDRLQKEKRKIADLKKASIRDPRLPPPGPKVRIGPAFEGKQFHDNRSSVLAQFTVYSPWYQPRGRPEAQWPCPQEMAEEGDERYTSNFRRMTAVPRDPCNETVSYKQRPFILPMSLDSIWGSPWRVPTVKKVEEMITLEDDMRAEMEIGEEYIGQSLLDAIDCIDEP